MTDFYWLIVSVLATWRVSHLLHAEDGPWNVIVSLRAAAGAGFFGEMMDCFYCLSIWVALPIAFLTGVGWLDRLLLWPALSAASILVDRAIPEHTARRDAPPSPVQVPDKE